MLRFIKMHNIKYKSKFINKDTGKTAWIFEMTPELDEILTKWSNNKSYK
jgi:glycine cleavage system H lipoate-binding protein